VRAGLKNHVAAPLLDCLIDESIPEPARGAQQTLTSMTKSRNSPGRTELPEWNTTRGNRRKDKPPRKWETGVIGDYA